MEDNMTKTLTRTTGFMPSVFDDFFKPWNDWFDNSMQFNRMLTVPAVNITENKDSFQLSMAVPGMKKEDLNIDIEGNLLTISAEKEEKAEDKKLNREEYNYSCFSRTFTLPEDVKKDKIDAEYKDGVLKMVLPKTEEARKGVNGRHLTVK
jgi:HSP20 family protein